jgi:hypothetical protein
MGRMKIEFERVIGAGLSGLLYAESLPPFLRCVDWTSMWSQPRHAHREISAYRDESCNKR